MLALKITAIGLVLVWLALFLLSELVETSQKLDRRALPEIDDWYLTLVGAQYADFRSRQTRPTIAPINWPPT